MVTVHDQDEKVVELPSRETNDAGVCRQVNLFHSIKNNIIASQVRARPLGAAAARATPARCLPAWHFGAGCFHVCGVSGSSATLEHAAAHLAATPALHRARAPELTQPACRARKYLPMRRAGVNTVYPARPQGDMKAQWLVDYNCREGDAGGLPGCAAAAPRAAALLPTSMG